MPFDAPLKSARPSGPECYVGVLSGTSIDGLSLCLVDLSQPAPLLIHALCLPFPGPLQTQLRSLASGGEDNELHRCALAEGALGEFISESVLKLLNEAGTTPAQVRAIGSHGQTIRHSPPGRETLGYSVQIGDPNRIAERTGITVVADFRRRDMAAGGQGAPLVPAFHAAVFSSQGETRAVLNLGGIANLTLLPRGGVVSGFDTGPANTLLDRWCERHTGRAFDASGAWAREGKIDVPLLERLLNDAYFSHPAPKSTGPEYFNLHWLQERGGEQVDGLPAQDVQATLTALSALSVANALQQAQPGTQRLLACGGGVLNTFLMEILQEKLPGITLETTDAHGVPAPWVEALAFAWLAQQTLNGRPGNLPAVTGAARPVVLGGIYPA